MKITRRQLRRIIREAVGDQLPYSMGGPWVDKDAPVGKGASQYDDLDMELADKEIEASMGWESADEWYVVERTGASWDERFFVEMTGWRPERIVYGPFDKAKGFTTEAEAEKVQVTIDEMDGYHTRIQPASFFQEGK